MPPRSRSAPTRSPRRCDAGGASAASPIEIVRTGSRGLLWLEPMVEVETPQGRIAYGPVTPSDVAGLLDAGMLDGGAASRCASASPKRSPSSSARRA